VHAAHAMDNAGPPPAEWAQHFFGVLEWRDLVNDATGLHVEGWLASSDAGTYFKAGTTEVVAEMTQGCVDVR
jgi:hypothetical protein